MFSGIVEEIGVVETVEKEGSNLIFGIWSSFLSELKIDQSIAHNGACLTVTDVGSVLYKVTAIEETLQKTNLGSLKIGGKVNLERCLKLSDRIDGHIVQGHVDTTALVKSVAEKGGSWFFEFEFSPSDKFILVNKGSVTINGVSLTVVDCSDSSCVVAVIPYTFQNTTFHLLKSGDSVNIEFDILGKYIAKLYNSRN